MCRIINFNANSMTGISITLLYDMIDNEGNFVFQQKTGAQLLAGLTLSISDTAYSFTFSSIAQTGNWSLCNPNPAITYATFNPLDAYTGFLITNSNLTENSNGVIGQVRATIPILSGNKRYWEVTVGGAVTTNMVIGITTLADGLSFYTGQSAGYGFYGNPGSGGNVIHGGAFVGTGYTSGYNVGDIIGIALDLVGNTVQFYRNGSITGTAILIAGGTWYPACGSGGGAMITTANFGATNFAYTVPSGFVGGVY